MGYLHGTSLCTGFLRHSPLAMFYILYYRSVCVREPSMYSFYVDSYLSDMYGQVNSDRRIASYYFTCVYICNQFVALFGLQTSTGVLY